MCRELFSRLNENAIVYAIWNADLSKRKTEREKRGGRSAPQG